MRKAIGDQAAYKEVCKKMSLLTCLWLSGSWLTRETAYTGLIELDCEARPFLSFWEIPKHDTENIIQNICIRAKKAGYFTEKSNNSSRLPVSWIL